MSVAGVISPAQVTGSVNSKNGFGGCTGNQGWKCDVKLTQNGEHSATRVYPPSSRDMKRFALGLSSCRRRSPNAAVHDRNVIGRSARRGLKTARCSAGPRPASRSS